MKRRLCRALFYPAYRREDRILIHLKSTDYVTFNTESIQFFKNTSWWNCRDWSGLQWFQDSSVQPAGRRSAKSLSAPRLAVLLVLEGQTQEAARDKDMGVYNSKKPQGLVGVKEITCWSDRVSILALPSRSPSVVLLQLLQLNLWIIHCNPSHTHTQPVRLLLLCKLLHFYSSPPRRVREDWMLNHTMCISSQCLVIL